MLCCHVALFCNGGDGDNVEEDTTFRFIAMGARMLPGEKYLHSYR